MNIVQPGSATVNSNGVLRVAGQHARRPLLADDGTRNRHGHLDCPSAASAPRRAGVVRPSPSTRTSAAPPVWVTRTSCSGASGGPVNSSVDSAEMTCTPRHYGVCRFVSMR